MARFPPLTPLSNYEPWPVSPRLKNLRESCNAPRGWEPWQKWEDNFVEMLVTGSPNSPVGTVQQLAQKLQRTENAILCRIEKKYGERVRDRFAGCTNREQTMNYEPSDAKIYWGAIADIQRVKNHPFFDPTRFAYRVTLSEFRAIGRHMAHNGWVPHGVGFPIAVSILGVEVLPVMAEVAPVIKDYGSSG